MKGLMNDYQKHLKVKAAISHIARGDIRTSNRSHTCLYKTIYILFIAQSLCIVDLKKAVQNEHR